MTSARYALVSLVVGVLVLALKAIAAAITGSVALTADALESIVNVVGALVALSALRLAAKPADAKHPYGHFKAENLSAGFEGTLVLGAALAILAQSIPALFAPRTLAQPEIGLSIAALSGVVNAGLAAYLLAGARRLHSPALDADARHLLGDVASSIGVIFGAALAYATGYAIFDPIAATLVAIYILWSGWTVIRSSLSGLMDEALPADEFDTLLATLREHASGAIEAHDVRARQAGAARFVDLHLVVPSDMTVETAHGICDRIEQAIARALPGDHVKTTVHLEPEHKAKAPGEERPGDHIHVVLD